MSMASIFSLVRYLRIRPGLCPRVEAGHTKGGGITVPLTSCFTGLQIKTKIVSSHTDDSKPVKQEINGTMILPPLVFPSGGN